LGTRSTRGAESFVSSSPCVSRDVVKHGKGGCFFFFFFVSARISRWEPRLLLFFFFPLCSSLVMKESKKVRAAWRPFFLFSSLCGGTPSTLKRALCLLPAGAQENGRQLFPFFFPRPPSSGPRTHFFSALHVAVETHPEEFLRVGPHDEGASFFCECFSTLSFFAKISLDVSQTTSVLPQRYPHFSFFPFFFFFLLL